MKFTIRMILFIYFLFGLSTAKKFIQDSIGFPEAEENIKQVNKDNRSPVFLPSMCQENELFYPGDQKDDWICDCRPAHLYHPKTDKCWPAYRQGPCPMGEYLILLPTSAIPVCQKNHCHVDNYVLWNNNCEQLGSPTPCTKVFPAASSLGVNSTTLNISCIKLNLESRFSEDFELERCPLGGKRSVLTKQCLPKS